jgi:hypothetical protein
MKRTLRVLTLPIDLITTRTRAFIAHLIETNLSSSLRAHLFSRTRVMSVTSAMPLAYSQVLIQLAFRSLRSSKTYFNISQSQQETQTCQKALNP